MSSARFVVVSGLPGSGKTTLGRALSERLGLPLIDKDDILECLFDVLGCTTFEERHRLSRAAYEVLFRMAATAGSAVLVNWWHHDTAPDRLRSLSDDLVEVFCECPVEVAMERFIARRRHPGHLDHLRTPADHAESARHFSSFYPGPLILGGTVVKVQTDGTVDVDSLIDEVMGWSPCSRQLPGAEEDLVHDYRERTAGIDHDA